MKARKINILDRAALVKLCDDEGLVLAPTSALHAPTPIAVRSFLGLSADVVAATPENTLLLTDQFRRRYLKEEFDWERDIRPSVETFLRDVVKRSLRLELILDAHASIALLAGSVLDFKSGANVDLFQKGRVGGRIWRADDGSDANATTFAVADEKRSDAPAIAVGIGVSQSVDAQMRAYVSAQRPDVGRILSFALPSGPGQQGVRGGAHAAALAEQVSNVIRAAKANDLNATVHLFAACPNSLLFFLGQQHQGYAPAIVYEFDFDREGNRSYLPAFVLGT